MDRLLALDFGGNGNVDHLVVCRPATDLTDPEAVAKIAAAPMHYSLM